MCQVQPLPGLFGRGLVAGVAFLTTALSIVPFDQRVLTTGNAPFESFHLWAPRYFTLHQSAVYAENESAIPWYRQHQSHHDFAFFEEVTP